MGIHNYGKRSKKPREIIEREVPAIVSAELWAKAQETLKNNFRWAKRNSLREYLLRGLIKCGICSRNLTGSFFKGKKKEYSRWYRCNGKFQHVQEGTGEEACKCKSIKSEWIENLIWGELKDWILNPHSLDYVLSRKLDEYENEKSKWFVELKNLKTDLQTKEEERTKILSLYRKGLISMDDVEKQLEDIEDDKVELEIMIAELKSKLLGDFSKEQAIKEINSRLNEFKTKAEANTISWEYKRNIIETFVNEVQVNVTTDNSPLKMIDTIPIRTTVKDHSPKRKSKIDTVYMRVSDGVETQKSETFEGNTINISYRFPLPSPQISSIVDHTGMDSSRLLT